MAKVSVVITTRNESAHIRHLLDSLSGQDLHEVILVDAQSTDDTVAIAQSYEGRLPIKVHVERCSRGRGRNLGAQMATGDLLAFTDGDCLVNRFWAKELARAWGGRKRRIVAGHTINLGYWAFTRLHRVELPHEGQDTTWPSCNLAYPREMFLGLGGFDESFVTAEDIDLNFRAIEAGATIVHAPDAIVYAHARNSVGGFLKQAYWNGYGRKQLTAKHGRLWHEYSFGDMVKIQGRSLWGVTRMACGAFGYVNAKLRGGKHP